MTKVSTTGFQIGDVVGCGLVLPKKQIFYTVNGKLIGTAFNDVDFLSKEKTAQ